MSEQAYVLFKFSKILTRQHAKQVPCFFSLHVWSRRKSRSLERLSMPFQSIQIAVGIPKTPNLLAPRANIDDHRSTKCGGFTHFEYGCFQK